MYAEIDNFVAYLKSGQPFDKDFKIDMDNWIQAFRKAKTIKPDQKVIIPGDMERETEQKRMQELQINIFSL